METKAKVRWMCPKQAAERLGMSAETVRRWLRDREIPGRKIRGTWFVPVAFLDGLETGGQAPGPPAPLFLSQGGVALAAPGTVMRAFSARVRYKEGEERSRVEGTIDIWNDME